MSTNDGCIFCIAASINILTAAFINYNIKGRTIYTNILITTVIDNVTSSDPSFGYYLFTTINNAISCNPPSNKERPIIDSSVEGLTVSVSIKTPTTFNSGVF